MRSQPAKAGGAQPGAIAVMRSGPHGNGGALASAEAGPSVAVVDPPRPGKAKAMSVPLDTQSELDLQREQRRREDEAEMLGWLVEQAPRRVEVAIEAVATRKPFPTAFFWLQRWRNIFFKLAAAASHAPRMPLFASTGRMAHRGRALPRRGRRGRARPRRGREAGAVTRFGRGGLLV